MAFVVPTKIGGTAIALCFEVEGFLLANPTIAKAITTIFRHSVLLNLRRAKVIYLNYTTFLSSLKVHKTKSRTLLRGAGEI
jgi:hypothetical protein